MSAFRLFPFAPVGEGLSITGAVARAGGTLRATYHLAGDLSAVVVPRPAPAPERRDGLWRATCFELFVAWPGEGRYLEVNLSPAGHWNAYAFAGERAGMAPLPVARFAAQLGAQGTPGALVLGFELEPALELPAALEVGVSAVLAHASGPPSYWALRHGGGRPDFHRRDAFLLRL